MPPLYVVLGVVALQRACEVAYAARNTRALLRRGAFEAAAMQYPFIVALHAAWLLSMLFFVPATAPVNWYLIGLYGALQVLRLWIILSLGERWTTRIVVLPGASLVRRGPYRVMRHPNYAVVALEIATLPCAFGAYAIAATFTVLNAALLWWRITAEERALGGFPHRVRE